MPTPYHLQDSQILPATPQELFQFFMVPDNLSKIMPPYLNMKVVKATHIPLVKGAEIHYTVKRAGIKLKWHSKIPESVENQYFVDEMVTGPFAFWKHTHILKPTQSGTEVIDDLYILPPFGVLGRLAWHLGLKQDLLAIFEYRRQRMDILFPKK